MYQSMPPVFRSLLFKTQSELLKKILLLYNFASRGRPARRIASITVAQCGEKALILLYIYTGTEGNDI